MAAAVACARFSQNAWRREMCANCFKAKTEHAAPPPRPPPPPAHAQPQHSILKGIGKRPEKRPQRTNVCFHKEESEIIGFDGGDVSSGEEDCDSPDGCNSDLPESSFPELSDAEDKELQSITQKNTDFNSDNANLLKASAIPVPITNGNKITVNIKNTVTNTNGHKQAPKAPKETKQHKSTIPIVSVTPFGSKPTAVCAPTPKERVVVVERKPPLGHESTTAPLTAPALVKLQAKEVTVQKKESTVVKIEVPSKPIEEVSLSLTPSDSDASTLSEDEAKKPAFMHHKDSVDLISPPRSPVLNSKNEQRPAPIGKVASDLTIALKNNAVNAVANNKPGFEKRKKNGAKLSEARSSALIRRWTVGERVLIQPRRAIVDAPEIVPLTLHSPKQLEPRELSGEPDGEDSSVAVVDQQPPVVDKVVEEIVKAPEITMDKVEEPEVFVEVPLDAEVEEELIIEEVEKPPTPPSSPLPDEDLPPQLPNTPPPILQGKTPPARPTSLPGAANSTARSSFLHSALLGRPQVPVKPAALMLANVSSSGRRHQTTPVAVAVPSPVTPVKIEDTLKTIVQNQPIVTPEAQVQKPAEVETFVTPKSIFTPSFTDGGKPPILSPRPKMGSYKKRQAPKPPMEEMGRDRTPSGDSFEELTRRDSMTSVDKGTLQSKKNSGRFSLRRLLRMGSKEERPISPESCASPTSMPSSPESPIRPEIIHPSNLDGRQVEVVSRVQHSVEQSPPVSPTTPTTPPPVSMASTSTPPARPRPPPPPRTMSLPQSPAQRPARPPPPQSVQLLQMREKANDQVQAKHEDSIYANLDSVKSRAHLSISPSKPQRSGSMREIPEKTTGEDGDYETVQFKDGKTIKRRRSVILGSLEENYGAVVGANHRALAQLVSVLTTIPLPSEVTSVSVPCYAGECRNVDEKGLVVLQILMELRKMHQTGTTTASLDQFKIIRPKDATLSEIGPRVEIVECQSPAATFPSIAGKVCQLLVPSDSVLPSLLEEADLQKAVTYLEFKTWGPEVAPIEREVALQRWLDLERATALQSLAQNRSANRLAIAQEMFVNFLVQASAVSLAQASKLISYV